jgi:hypothetical protein
MKLQKNKGRYQPTSLCPGQSQLYAQHFRAKSKLFTGLKPEYTSVNGLLMVAEVYFSKYLSKIVIDFFL